MEKQKASFSPLLSDDESSRSSTDTDVNFPGQTLTSIGWKTHMFGRWYPVALLCSIIILILTTATLIMLVILNHKSSSNQKLAVQSSVWCSRIPRNNLEQRLWCPKYLSRATHTRTRSSLECFPFLLQYFYLY
jgi:hypothetical protein